MPDGKVNNSSCVAEKKIDSVKTEPATQPAAVAEPVKPAKASKKAKAR